MKHLIIFELVSLVLLAILYIRRRNRPVKEIAELKKLPPVTPDFATPEGAILCLEVAHANKDLEAAVACRDFVTQARLWIHESGCTPEQFQEKLLSEMTVTMEKTFRKGIEQFGWGIPPVGCYFPQRTPYGEGLVVVSTVKVGPDRSLFRQRILTSQTATGWRVVTPLVETPNGWRVTPRLAKP
jgi:hypothetical protein